MIDKGKSSNCEPTSQPNRIDLQADTTHGRRRRWRRKEVMRGNDDEKGGKEPVRRSSGLGRSSRESINAVGETPRAHTKPQSSSTSEKIKAQSDQPAHKTTSAKIRNPNNNPYRLLSSSLSSVCVEELRGFKAKEECAQQTWN